jgi:hypothetical protein
MLGFKTTDFAEPLTVSAVRPLDEFDLALVGTGPTVKPSPLARLGARHHALAKALADGMRPGIAAATYGYCLSRVSILQSDPSFDELVAHYRAEAEHDYARVHERLTGIAVDALDEIDKRLQETPDQISTGTLAKLVELTTDRTGHGKKGETEVNINIGFADRLRAARERIKIVSAPTIEGELLNAG